MYGFDGRRSTGYAPFAASPCTNARTSALYCALLSDHGVTRPGPESSFRTMTGFEQPVCCWANAKKLWTRPGMSDGLAGAVVVPTRFLKFRSK